MSASIGTRGSKVTKVLDDAPVGTTVFDGTTTITDTQTKSWGETATFWKKPATTAGLDLVTPTTMMQSPAIGLLRKFTNATK